MPVISLWGLVISLAVLALGLVYKVVENSHALKLADKESDRLRSKLDALEQGKKNETPNAMTLDNKCISEGHESRLATSHNINNQSRKNIEIRSVAPSHLDQHKDKISTLSEALSLEAVLQCLGDKDTTPLQKSMFVEHNTGCRIAWRGRVEDVQKMWEREKESDLMIIISSPNDSESFKKLATAIFSNSEIHSLAQVKSGDIILFEGNLQFSELAGRWSTSLKDSRFIRFEKNA